ncbi:xylulokinase [uncultured Cetobacterium sp.]|uniref:xylulokinase n=1 Tax=uncultured Cetobacterium sp. TaxID=527638 RepID=UPI0026115464|nr:xylulokinase [uncultured Cetobacterium sp.]
MYIGIDLGTSAVKILLMDKNGDIIKTISQDYPLLFPQENWIEQNPDDWFNATLKGLKEITLEYKNINALSFSGQMHGLVLLDKNDSIIRPAMLWCDQRTEEQCKTLNTIENIIELTGNIALTGFTAPKILWLKENEPDNFKKIHKIMLPKDYIAFKLTGKYSTDVSDASGTLLLDVKNRVWSKEMLNFIGINISQLPELYESFQVVGNILPSISSLLNLNSETKVIAGAGDQAAGAIGVGVIDDSTLSVALGTSGVVFASMNSYFADSKARLHSFCHANGKYHQMGVMLSAAGALKWWVENIQKSKDYNLLIEKEAKESEIDTNLFFLPYLIGERTPHNDPNAKGTITGLNIQHTRGDLTRSIIEGITFGLRDSLELIKSCKDSFTSIRVSGGGAKSDFWKQTLADIFNLKVDTINSTEGPAFGAAILAIVGDGLFKDVNEACSALIKIVETKEPIERNIDIYNKKYSKFKTLYPILKEI